MKQGDRNGDSVLVTGATAGSVTANLILSPDPSNPGNAIVADGASAPFLGVTDSMSDLNGYVSYRSRDYVQIYVGASAVTAGDEVTSDPSGKATTIVPAASGGAVKNTLGVALNTAAAGTLVDVLIQPKLTAG
jgi:hypothetical protein